MSTEEKFMTDNYKSILRSIGVVSKEYTCWKSTDPSPIDIITDCFLLTYTIYLDKYCTFYSKDTSRFALSVVTYTDCKLQNDRDALLTNDKLRHDWILEKISINKTNERHNLEYLSERISLVLACCMAKDDELYLQFCTTLKDYAETLINFEQLQVTSNALRFNQEFNKCILKLKESYYNISPTFRDSRSDFIQKFIDTSLSKICSNYTRSKVVPNVENKNQTNHEFVEIVPVNKTKRNSLNPKKLGQIVSGIKDNILNENNEEGKISNMDSRAREFTNAFYVDYLNAVGAVTEVLKASGEYELDPSSLVRNTFLRSTLTYVEYCGERVTNELAEFAMDIYFYFDDEFTEWIEDLDASKKREQIFNYIEAVGATEAKSLDELSNSLEYVLSLCKVYDDAADTSTQRSLCGALTRFAYLLIKTDSVITKSEENFYCLFKERLTHALSSDVHTTHINKFISVAPSGNASISYISPEEELQRITKDIDSLTGLDNIKREVEDLLNMLKVQKMRRDSGLAVPEISKHMLFYGNPGTGKTTIARKLAEIYRVLGVLSKGHLVETDRASLVAGYLGQTAIKTTEILEQAKGGILFIDEAYTLCQGGEQDQYGQEAIDTILKYMEDNRDDLIVIVAGYESKMSGFINSNPGLKSRFNKYFHFIDYDATQLAAIFTKMATQSQYIITPNFALLLENLCELMITRKGENFGNGRTVRNLFERCVTNQANRVVGIDNPSHKDLIELLDGDLTIQDLDVVMR